jgi:ABC-2 type transport system ATP-binding protein
MEEAEALCPEVALMHQGRLLARGAVKRLLDAHGGGDRLEARLNRKAPATLLKAVPGLLGVDRADGGRLLTLHVAALAPALQAFSRAAAKARVEVHSLSTHKATLEDLFLALAGGRLDGDAPSEAGHA